MSFRHFSKETKGLFHSLGNDPDFTTDSTFPFLSEKAVFSLTNFLLPF